MNYYIKIILINLILLFASCSDMMQNYDSSADEDVPPVPSVEIIINNGDKFCYNRHVQISCDYQYSESIDSIAFSDDNINWTNMIKPVNVYPWDFDYIPCEKTVFCKYVDSSGVSRFASDSIMYLDRISEMNTYMFSEDIAVSGDFSVIAVSGLIENKGNLFLCTVKNDDWQIYRADLGSETDYMTGLSISMNLSGTEIAVGDSNNNSGKGRVIILKRGVDGGTSLFQHLDSTADKKFGYSTDLSDSEDILAVTALGDGVYSGALMLYKREPAGWNIMETFVPSALDSDDKHERFGNCVSLSSNGSAVAVGDPEYKRIDAGVVTICGRVTVYRKSAGVYAPIELYEEDKTTLSVSVLSTGINFGDAVSLNSDASLLAVGVPQKGNGEVIIYRYDSVNEIYYRIKTLGCPPGNVFSGGYSFGGSLDFSAENRLFINAPFFSDSNLGDKCGNIFISDFPYNSIGSYITPDAAADDYFGYSFAASADGKSVAVGSLRDDRDGINDAGSVYIIRNSSVFK
ncbi:MAG: FG-GAP repeat protein [Spirochaetes bacterium]|nr:FG-GAP repeat protein [Spirochaetota bacterium]